MRRGPSADILVISGGNNEASTSFHRNIIQGTNVLLYVEGKSLLIIMKYIKSQSSQETQWEWDSKVKYLVIL